MTTMMTDTAVGALMPGVFVDPRFREGRIWCWHACVEGTKIGIVLATQKLPFTGVLVNKPELDRLLAAKRAGKIDHAMVVAASVTSSGIGARTYRYLEHREAEDLYAHVKLMTPRNGVYGAFWTLPNLKLEALGPNLEDAIPF
jgi:hypothetical protein